MVTNVNIGLNISKNPEDFPDYIHPDLEDILEDLELVNDLWEGMRKNTIRKYIHQHAKEPDDAYKLRLKRSEFDNYFRPTIEGYSGLLSNFTLSQDVALSIVEHQNDIDGQGNDLRVFLADADNAVLRDGCCGFIIDFPDTTGLNIVSPLDLKTANLRPYLSLVERRQMINWRQILLNGKQILSLLIIEVTTLEEKGEYGVSPKTIYRVFKRGNEKNGNRCQVMEFSIEEESGKKTLIIEKEPVSLTAQEIPIVLYSTSERNPLTTIPPFLNTAKLNTKLLRKQSELDEVMYRINLPVPVREGAEGSYNAITQKVEYPPLVLGSNSAVDVPIGGKFYFAEPTGAAIAGTQADIASLKQAIDRVSLAFLGGSKEGSMTATEALLNTAQVTTTINTIARRKESVVEAIFQWWIFYTGEKTGGTIAIDDSVIQPAMTDQGAQVVLDAMGVSISRELGFTILRDRNWLPEGIDIEKEIAMMERLSSQAPEPNDASPVA
jgi:hypothetical protein